MAEVASKDRTSRQHGEETCWDGDIVSWHLTITHLRNHSPNPSGTLYLVIYGIPDLYKAELLHATLVLTCGGTRTL